MRILVLILCAFVVAGCATHTGIAFNVQDTGAPSPEAQALSPWKTVTLDPDYAGMWVVAGDVNNDGAVELISAETFNENDTHYTSAVAAHSLAGEVLWAWGDPEVGWKKRFYDVACQIHDWDNDGRAEVVVATKDAVVELDGATGKEKRRFPIPEGASDCLVFCNLSGGDHPRDVLVKTRYNTLYAYDYTGTLLWEVTNPGGYRTAHQPVPLDIDRDGRDEIMAGYALLNADGSVRWTLQSEAVPQAQGHLDCMRVLRRGKRPEDWRLAMTLCGANCLTVTDGTGKIIWEQAGRHYESIDVGKVLPGHGPAQIVVDVDHQPEGLGDICIFDEHGVLSGCIVPGYARHHVLLDWTGDDLLEIVVAHSRAVYNHEGQRIFTFAVPEGEFSHDYEPSLITGDMSGDGIPDIGLVTPTKVFLYKNIHGSPNSDYAGLGTERNFTLY